MFSPVVIIATIAVLTLHNGLTAGELRNYANYGVYRITPTTRQTLNFLRDLESFPAHYVFLDGIHQLGQEIDVLVAPEAKATFLDKILTEKLSYQLLAENVGEELENDELAEPYRRTNDYAWHKYHTLNDTYEWMNDLVEQHKGIVDVVKVGSTHEKRDILGMRISYGKLDKKRAIFLEGGMHAREWISPATTAYIAHEILTNADKQVRSIVEKYDWYIVPHANPDGYEYTQTTDRLWRKTRTPYGNNCFGADPNRNWDHHWNEVGASNNPCSDTYAGPTAFSEIETRSLAKYLDTVKEELFLYISLHAYSQLLLFPYGYTGERPANYADLQRIYNVSTQKLSERYGTRYTGGNIYEAIYPASGSTVDYAYGALDINYSYCYELRPSSRQFWTGFRLPANQIIPTGEETFDSILAMVQEADTVVQEKQVLTVSSKS